MAGNRNSGGHNKKPIALKKIQGTTHSTRDRNSGFSVPEITNFSMPSDLKLTGYGEQIWNQQAPILIRAGILKESDIPAFAVYCNEFGRYIAMAKIVKEHGEIYIDKSGTPKKRPEMLVMNDALKIVISYQGRFGLTPADRDRIKVEEKKSEGIGGLIT